MRSYFSIFLSQNKFLKINQIINNALERCIMGKKIIEASDWKYAEPIFCEFLIHLLSALFTIWLTWKKTTRHIANHRPLLFFWLKYASPVHYGSFGWFLKNLYREQKIENIDSAYRQSTTSTIFFGPKYASPVHCGSFGWFKKNCTGSKNLKNLICISPIADSYYFLA